MAAGGTNYCRAHFSAQFSNMQNLGNNNQRKNHTVSNRTDVAELSFFSEVNAATTTSAGMMVISAQDRAHPSGSLNYMVPVGSTLTHPQIAAADLVNMRARTGSKASTYEGYWGRDKHPRYPVHMGQDSTGTQIYGYHGKSSPNGRQSAATAAAILHIHDQHDPIPYAIGGDFNLSPTDLAAEINAIRPGVLGVTMFIRDDGATHRRGGSLDYVVTNRNPSMTQKMGHANLRSGSDHTGIGFKY